jgi:hypothetical protein
LLVFVLIFFSFIMGYWRFPIEFLWVPNTQSWWLSLSIYFLDILGLI